MSVGARLEECFGFDRGMHFAHARTRAPPAAAVVGHVLLEHVLESRQIELLGIWLCFFSRWMEC